MKAVLRVRRKGVVILPKKLREAAGISEGDEVYAEVAGGAIVLKPLRPTVVDVDPSLVEKLLREEYELEEGAGVGGAEGSP
ncbi:AbrB/MazE/SpoVT family DNA-binding domain-containing protein [Thermofilum pendens]|uniref:Transcriptional regulator, AbrB family n=1 Tax=Thermofilum pendens (strain DSM 2475 / Hrk 5) TaxID=368408 RepID=A1RZV7_THEPD|nr:AbrB/MazE/SpoVT family DNA-binding domain-containing protein [Thermofilum pendens]ABL78737.1 transcriptional regulator, AbrB family [Thermofilum pendens Hrk 5]